MKGKLNLQLIVAAVLCVFGCTMLTAGFIVAPKGQIHESVLVAFGEVMTFAGALFGFDYHYRGIIKNLLKDKENDKG